MIKLLKIIKEIFNDKKIICGKCGHSWDLSDGGKDPYKCHKCGNIIKESPDTVNLPDDRNSARIHILRYNDGDAIGFAFDEDGKFYTTDYGQTHGEDIPVNQTYYDGRIWTDKKIVSFWENPENAAHFRDIANLLQDRTGINILSPEWRIEIKTKGDMFAPEFIPTREYGEVSDEVIDPSEEEYQKHLDRMKTDIPKGWGSKKRPAGLTATQRKQMQSTSENIKLKNLIESPDIVYVPEYDFDVDYESNDAYPFYYINGKIYKSEDSGEMHSDIYRNPKYNRKQRDEILDSNDVPYGRIWLDAKMLSFWKYPKNKREMKDVADALSKEFSWSKIDVWNDFNVEIYGEFDDKTDYIVADEDVIPVKKYRMSDEPPEEERIQHLLSPAQKSDLKIPHGWGSKKTPAGLSATQRHQMKSTSEDIE
jgi:hypothetical protein